MKRFGGEEPAPTRRARGMPVGAQRRGSLVPIDEPRSSCPSPIDALGPRRGDGRRPAVARACSARGSTACSGPAASLDRDARQALGRRSAAFAVRATTGLPGSVRMADRGRGQAVDQPGHRDADDARVREARGPAIRRSTASSRRIAHDLAKHGAVRRADRRSSALGLWRGPDAARAVALAFALVIGNFLAVRGDPRAGRARHSPEMLARRRADELPRPPRPAHGDRRRASRSSTSSTGPCSASRSS